jgi:iron complex outermembrane receptor protein
LRHDVNSLYSEGYNSGNFPTAGLTYNISNGILKGNTIINDLKVRFAYGVSGMTQSVINDAINHTKLTFETTESKDLVIDYGLFNNRINGEIDLYNRNTKNLTNNAYISNATGSLISYTNSGNNSNKGFEITLNSIPVKMHNFSWSVSMNAAYQKSVLSGYSSIPYLRSPVNGNYVQVTSDGYAPVMFYVFKQLYASNGKPIEGLYQDINGDGRIDSNDEIAFHSPLPDWIFGFNTQLTFKRWTAGCSFRGSIGNYVYNATNAIYGNSGQSSNDGFLRNVSTDYLYTGFQNREMNSSYYVENASFLKLDNISLFYQAGEIAKGINLKAGAIIQNVLTFTRYSGVDPEIPGGIDYGFYPRPRIYSINIHIDF